MKVALESLPKKSMQSIFDLSPDDIILDEFDIVWRITARPLRHEKNRAGKHDVHAAQQQVVRVSGEMYRLADGGPESILEFVENAHLATYKEAEILKALGFL